MSGRGARFRIGEMSGEMSVPGLTFGISILKSGFLAVAFGVA
jgi:hypothetical protein